MEEYLKQFENYKLCYVDSSEYTGEPMMLYFTEQELDKQWGDDWDDVPYEHNAGTPYTNDYSQPEQGVKDGVGIYPKIGIMRVYITTDFDVSTPRTGTLNSPYCVRDINKGVVPWISIKRDNKKSVFIKAGTTLKEFLKIYEKEMSKQLIFVQYQKDE